MKTFLHVVGARPNFMKVAPIHRALAKRGKVKQVLVHTGQHYDPNMSDVFFRDLAIPPPDVHLGVGSGSHAQQTATVMVELEKLFTASRPDLVSVVGDVNSTLAAALVAAKMVIPLAHVEAGLRSFDRTMPEEVNRIVTDRLSDLLLTPSEDGNENLRKEGVPEEKIHLVGNVMIDSLLWALPSAQKLPVLQQLGLTPGKYAVCTLHRPSNVDDPKILGGLLDALLFTAERMPVVFPIHPRTRKQLAGGDLGPKLEKATGLKLVEPMGYLEFLCLTSQAGLVLTDSGGLQEETTALEVPCLTLRENTERPITVTLGTNQVVGANPETIKAAVGALASGKQSVAGRVVPLWDGKASERIAEVYEKLLG